MKVKIPSGGDSKSGDTDGVSTVFVVFIVFGFVGAIVYQLPWIFKAKRRIPQFEMSSIGPGSFAWGGSDAVEGYRDEVEEDDEDDENGDWV